MIIRRVFFFLLPTVVKNTGNEKTEECFFKIAFFLGGWGGWGEALHFQHRTTTSAHSMEVSLVQIQVHPHFCTQGEAQAVFEQTVKRPGETERLSCPGSIAFYAESREQS